MKKNSMWLVSLLVLLTACASQPSAAIVLPIYVEPVSTAAVVVENVVMPTAYPTESSFAVSYDASTQSENSALWANVQALNGTPAVDCFNARTGVYSTSDRTSLAITCMVSDGIGIIYTDRGTVHHVVVVALSTQAEVDEYLSWIGYYK